MAQQSTPTRKQSFAVDEAAAINQREANKNSQVAEQGALLQKEGKKIQNQTLVRHHSTPTRFKPVHKQSNVQAHDSNNTSTRHEDLLLNSSLAVDHMDRFRAHRHSHSCEQSPSCTSHHQQKHHHNRLHDGAHNSASPSNSSSASDSAFSQSQTTLESEIEQTTNCFRKHRSSLDTNHSLSNEIIIAPPYIKKTSSSASFGNDNLNELSQQDDSDQFKIIWHNLSYKVPEKRFSRLSACLSRHRERFWPQKVENEEKSSIDNNGIHTIGQAVQKDDSFDELPMHAPTIGKPRKIIFSSLNGCVQSGQLTAILGPSGAGKTTFLKCLTNSIVKGVSGSIDILGGSNTSQQLKLCIIPQKDYLFDHLTVMENLIFASRIKNTQANFDHMGNVARVATLLGLQACLKLKTNKLSGGQYKRVSIAQELLSKPDILILDEPTSGLDSLTCYRTVSVLRDLVDKSKAGLIPPLAIVMTIHQPQIKIFNLFHHVYVLSSMGQCVYEGPPEYLIDTVAESCKLLPPPDDLNPASFIIDLASEVYGSEPIDMLVQLQLENFHILHLGTSTNTDATKTSDLNIKSNVANNLSTLFEDSSNHLKGDKNIKIKFDEDQHVKQEILQTDEDLDANQLRISDRLIRRNNHDHNFWLHTGLLVKRLWISMWRDPLLTTTRISFHLIIPFVFYFIYSHKSGAANACPHVEREFDFQTMTSEENIQRLEVQHNELILTFENVSLFFLLLYSFSMCVLAVTALSFPLNMQILLKETSNGWYSMPRFVMAKTLADLPIETFMPMVSVAIAYVLTGQPSSYLCWRLLTVTAVMTLCSLISQTQGLLFGAYFMNNVQAAVFISQASSLPWILLSGFTTRVSELPTVLQWLSFGSIYRLGIESILAVRYGFGMCPCDKEIVNDTPVKMVGIPDQLRSVVRYYFDMYTDSSSPTTNSTGDIFEKIASTMSRANTFGVDIVNCHDVRPFILSAREVDEATLPTFLFILVSIFVILKILLFFVVRLQTG